MLLLFADYFSTTWLLMGKMVKIICSHPRLEPRTAHVQEAALAPPLAEARAHPHDTRGPASHDYHRSNAANWLRERAPKLEQHNLNHNGATATIPTKSYTGSSHTKKKARQEKSAMQR